MRQDWEFIPGLVIMLGSTGAVDLLPLQWRVRLCVTRGGLHIFYQILNRLVSSFTFSKNTKIHFYPDNRSDWLIDFIDYLEAWKNRTQTATVGLKGGIKLPKFPEIVKLKFPSIRWKWLTVNNGVDPNLSGLHCLDTRKGWGPGWCHYCPTGLIDGRSLHQGFTAVHNYNDRPFVKPTAQAAAKRCKSCFLPLHDRQVRTTEQWERAYLCAAERVGASGRYWFG